MAKSHRLNAPDPSTISPDLDADNPVGAEAQLDIAPRVSSPVASITDPQPGRVPPPSTSPSTMRVLAQAVAAAFAPPADDGTRPAGAPVPIADPVGALINLANLCQARGEFLNGAPPPSAAPEMPPLPVVAAFLAALQDPALAAMFLSGSAPSGLGNDPGRLASGIVGPDLKPDPGLDFLIALHDGHGQATSPGLVPVA